MKRIVVAGYYGFDNAGDELILMSLLNNLKDMGKDLEITVLSANPEKSKSRYKVNSVNRWNPVALVKAVKMSDLLVFGGGGILQDITSSLSIMYYYGLIFLAGIFGRKVVMLGQGVGPIRRKFNKGMAKYILAKVNAVTVRDAESARVLKECGPDGLKTVVTADLVYGLAPKIRNNGSGKKHSSFTVGVVLKESGAAGLEKYIGGVCSKLQSEYGAGIIIIPFHLQSDRQVSGRIAGSIAAGEVVLWEEPSDIMAVYERIDVVIGMRLHSLILACLFGKPFIAIQPGGGTSHYDPKIYNFMKSIGLKPEDNTLNSIDMDYAGAAKRIHALFKDSDGFNGSIASSVEKHINSAASNMFYIKDLIGAK